MNPRQLYASQSTNRAERLRKRAEAFCQAFLESKAPADVLDEHFVADKPKITEHGPIWTAERLPFLGQTFEGRKECLNYFSLLGGRTVGLASFHMR